MAKPNTLLAVIAILIAGVLASSTLAAYYLYRFDQAQSDANAYLSELKGAQPTQYTNVLFDFGNGTTQWRNDTQVPTGANAYVATVIAADGRVNATYYPPPYSEHLVDGIDDLQNSAQQSWFIWTYNTTAHWQPAQSGADDLTASNGSIFAWTFCGYDAATYAPTCTP
jgi:hypothetical protein